MFGDRLTSEPYIFDFSSVNPEVASYDPTDFSAFQSQVFDEIHSHDKQWGIGRYKEERRVLLRDYDMMTKEKRWHHMWLDVIVPSSSQIFCPLDAHVFSCWREDEKGSYGGYIILQHDIFWWKFYSLYGHLSTPHRVSQWDKIMRGQCFAQVWEKTDSWGWFTHVHVQILTQKAIDEGRMLQWYVSQNDLIDCEEYFPDPQHMFRWIGTER